MLTPIRANGLMSEIHDGYGRIFLKWSTNTSGERIHTMSFKPYPRKVDMPENTQDQGRGILVELWSRLDAMIYTIRGESSSDDEVLRGQAKTMADTIALIMSPFYDSSDAVLREAMKRWKARQSETEHETPGLSEKVWDPSTRFDGTIYAENAPKTPARSKPAARPKRSVDNKSTRKLSADEAAGIKEAVASGMFSKQDVASMFKVSMETVETALA